MLVLSFQVCQCQDWCGRKRQRSSHCSGWFDVSRRLESTSECFGGEVFGCIDDFVEVVVVDLHSTGQIVDRGGGTFGFAAQRDDDRTPGRLDVAIIQFDGRDNRSIDGANLNGRADLLPTEQCSVLTSIHSGQVSKGGVECQRDGGSQHRRAWSCLSWLARA